MTSPVQQKSWIFQANPDRYAIETSIEKEEAEYWNLRQHAKEIKKGDEVFIWISGAEAGIYARGVVSSDPEVRSDSTEGMRYWVLKSEGSRPIARVWVRYTHVFNDSPLLRCLVRNDPVLAEMSVIKSPRGTNFAITNSERIAIASWLGDRGLLD